MMLCYSDAENVLNFCTIAEAVEMECAANLDDTGQIESTIENVAATAQAFGKLLAHLHKVGIISDEVLLDDLLGGAYEKCES